MANQKPVEEVRIGRVKATIWRNGTDEQPRHNVTFSRLYKEGDRMEEYAELRAQRFVGACESGRSSAHAHLPASGRSRTPGGSSRRVLAGKPAPGRGGAACFAALPPSFSFPVLDESPRLLPGELPAVPDFSPNSRAVQIAIARLPFPAAGLSRRKASARTLCSPSASVTGPCLCRPCPSPARAALFLLSGLLVFPLSCEGKTHQTIPVRRKHTMANSTFNRETNWRIITS